MRQNGARDCEMLGTGLLSSLGSFLSHTTEVWEVRYIYCSVATSLKEQAIGNLPAQEPYMLDVKLHRRGRVLLTGTNPLKG